MEFYRISEFLAVANYPSAPIMGGATLALLALIVGGGYWLKHAEAKARAAEKTSREK